MKKFVKFLSVLLIFFFYPRGQVLKYPNHNCDNGVYYHWNNPHQFEYFIRHNLS